MHPRERPSYLAANSFVAALAGGIGPLLGGAVAGAMELHRFSITASWESPSGVVSVPAFDLQGMDFAFILAFGVGVYAMHRLSLVAEGEPVERSAVVQTLLAEVKRPVVSFTTASGATDILEFPFNAVRQTSRLVGASVNEFGNRD